MGNTIGKVFVILLAALLLFIYPLLNMFEQQEKTSRLFVFTETTAFVDAVRNIGYLSPQMYEEFMEKLSATNNLYDIFIEHRHRRYDPIYGDPMNPATFEEDFAINYEAYYTQEVMSVLFPESGNGASYEFSSEDYFLVRVSNKNKTLGTRVKQMLMSAELPNQTIFVQYGGMIK